MSQIFSKWSLIVFTSFMLLTSPCDAQYMYAKIPPYDISNGLPHNGINDIVLDNEGYAWIATENGISRYDGYHFVNFNSTTNPGIFKDNRIVEIKKNGDILYLMTEADGLIEFKPSQLKFRKLSNEKPISISIANDTTAFLFGNGSLVLKKKDLIIFNKIFNVSDAASVLIYQGDILLSANQFEIFRIHLSEFNRIEKLSMQNPAWSSGDLMLSKKYGVVNWNGWRVFALKNNEFIEHPEFLGQVRVSFFEEENSGDVLWIDKFRIPVLQINHSNLAIHFAEEENIQYRCICRINETSFLIGTNQGLVQMCQTPDLSKRILDYPLIKYNEPIVRRRIIEHENKRYYLGFPYIVEENEKKELSHLSNTVLSTYDGVIFNNKLFCTTEGSGLVSFDLKTKKIVTHTNHILGAKDELNDISVFSDSLLLLTSFNKIISYNPKNKTGHSFSLENDNNIYVAAQIETGPFILLGTSKGLYRIKYSNENGFEFIENTLSEIKQIKDILIRQNANEIWLATDNGVATLRLDDFSIQKIYSSENEVSHPKVTALIEDLNGNIWASTYSGLTVYNTHDGSIKFLNKPQGIINHEFNYKSACALQNGQLAFGGLNAFEIIDPQKLSDFHYNNNFRIAGIQRIISDTRKEFLNYTNGETISFQTGSESVVIQLANLDYQYGVGYNFKYTIDGRNWFEADQNQQIILSDLSYGDYTLSIRMFDPFGNVVDEQIFPINARAPFYVKTEFHILFASLSILILALVAYSFMRSIRIRTVTKAKIAMDLHDESGTILTRLLLISNKEKFGTKEKAQIQNGLKEALFSFRTYLDSISNKKHSLQDLSDDLKEFIQSACGESEIHFDYKILFDKNYRLNRELYRDVKLSVYEVITNCLKHAHANFISLEINAKDKKLVLIICDNGTCKLENLSALNGNGIRNIINRAKRNSGTVKHFIEEGTTGLTTQITLPIV